MKKSNLSIILVRPQLPENIGMVARAMGNLGFHNLILVQPREGWPNIKAFNSSAKSKFVLKKVKIFSNLNQAIENFHFIIATSNRKRFLNKPFFSDFDNFFKKIPPTKKTAILFGPENSGLSNEDILLSDLIINIELSSLNNSLNLSHAVLLVLYKCYEHLKKSKRNNNKKSINNVAAKKDFNFFMSFLIQELDEVGFLYPKNKRKNMIQNIKTMFLRSELNKKEINTLWGMIKKLRKKN